MARRKGISAGAFMASFSSAGRLAPEQLQEQAVIAARLAALGLPVLTAAQSCEYRDAIDARRLAAIARMGRGCAHPTTVVERWNGAEWIEVKLTWTGSKYEEIN